MLLCTHFYQRRSLYVISILFSSLKDFENFFISITLCNIFYSTLEKATTRIIIGFVQMIKLRCKKIVFFFSEDIESVSGKTKPMSSDS